MALTIRMVGDFAGCDATHASQYGRAQDQTNSTIANYWSTTSAGGGGSVGAVINSPDGDGTRWISGPTGTPGLRCFTVASQTVALVRMRFRVSTVTSDQRLFALGTGAAVVYQVRLNTSGRLYFADNIGTVLATSTGLALVRDTVYDLEVGVFIDASGKVRFRRDGRWEDGLDRSLSLTGTFSNVEFSNANLDFGAFVLRTDTGDGFDDGDFLTDSVGNPQLAVLRPTADGTHLTFINVTGGLGAHYLEVDETVGDDATTYLRRTTDGDARETFVMSDLPGTARQVYAVVASALINQDAFPEIYFHLSLRGEGGDLDSSAPGYFRQELGGTGGSPDWWHTRYAWFENPVTEDPWTVDEVNALEVGVRRVRGNDFELSQVYLTVLFTNVEPFVQTPQVNDTALAQTCLPLARLWHLVRTDGEELFFTDSDRQIEAFGRLFDPASGFDASAWRSEAALRGETREFQGIISSDRITYDDMHARRYDECVVYEYVVNRRFPWIVHRIRKYWISDRRFDCEKWIANVDDFGLWLAQHAGQNVTRRCVNDLGDGRCRVQLLSITSFGLVVTTVDSRQQFHVDFATPPVTGWFNDGLLTWKSGANVGLRMMVASWRVDAETFVLHLETPFDIAPGDLFDCTPGCNKLPGGDRGPGDCNDTFDNLVNFGGFPDAPGRDAVLEAPRSV